VTTTKPTREELITLWAESLKAYSEHRAALEKYEVASRAYWSAWEAAGGQHGSHESLHKSEKK
jgi:hypothetical protein